MQLAHAPLNVLERGSTHAPPSSLGHIVSVVAHPDSGQSEAVTDGQRAWSSGPSAAVRSLAGATVTLFRRTIGPYPFAPIC